ncbi:MAG TPA: ABC transporter permease [candidate division Zixibacteria bacterium]|nr:ABC transporter permease [candidate division Zixibacteria bacterium]
MADGVGERPRRVTGTPARAGSSRSTRALWVTLVRVAIIGGFLTLWEIASGRWIEPFLISSPTRIVSSLITGFRSGDLLLHTWVTFVEIAIGFPLGAISGIALGYWFGRSRLLAEIFEPIIIALNGIPRTAVAPLFIVWLGIGLWSKVGVVFLLTFFLNFFNTYSGMRQMDQEYVDLARLMGVRGWRLSLKVIFPAISPYVFTGIRTSIPFSIIGAIVGEFIAATEGIGFFIRLSAGIFRTADVFVGIIVLMFMVILMDRVADTVEKRVLRWQIQTEHVQIQG